MLQQRVNSVLLGSGTMSQELKNIIIKNALNTVFQPIISLQSGEILGYEALTRAYGSNRYKNPEHLFEDAKRYDLLWDLEIICRANAIKSFSTQKADNKLLFINVDPETIRDEHFIKGFTKEILAEYNINPMSVVFEITEKTSIENYKNFNEILNYYKNQGYKIAIDDVGTGFSGLTTITNTRPHYIKMDMSLITGITRDNFKKAMVKTFVEFGNTTNTKIIAEGIEDINDLYTIMELGVHYGQGYLISKPAASIVETPAIIKKSILDKNINIRRHRFSPASNLGIGDIARTDPSVSPSTSCHEIEKLFTTNSNLKGIPIVDENSSILGLIMNSNFLSKVGTQYGWSLYMRKPIHLIMDSNPLIVSYETPLDKVSKIVIAREEDKLYDYILVEKNNKYYGIVPVITLLEKSMELELNVAKYSSPLTGLPGNVVIEDSILRALDEEKIFSLLYFDINDFKAFNDKYGFESGDKIISYTSSLIQKNLCACRDHFLGHIGGDDFVGIIYEDGVQNICQAIGNEFDEHIANFYSEQDRSLGYINSYDRNNREEIYPIMSLSIAVVTNKEKRYTGIYELTEDAAKIKKNCKIKSKTTLKSCVLIG